MQIKLKLRWRSFETGKLVNAPFHAPWTRLDARAKKTYRQRDEVKRVAFLAQVSDSKAAHLVYVDESGMDERDVYGYAWSKAGEWVNALKSGRRQGRVNMIASYYQGCQLIAPFTVAGTCNRTMFETWLETCLIPVLQSG